MCSQYLLKVLDYNTDNLFLPLLLIDKQVDFLGFLIFWDIRYTLMWTWGRSASLSEVVYDRHFSGGKAFLKVCLTACNTSYLDRTLRKPTEPHSLWCVRSQDNNGSRRLSLLRMSLNRLLWLKYVSLIRVLSRIQSDLQ